MHNIKKFNYQQNNFSVVMQYFFDHKMEQIFI